MSSLKHRVQTESEAVPNMHLVMIITMMMIMTVLLMVKAYVNEHEGQIYGQMMRCS